MSRARPAAAQPALGFAFARAALPQAYWWVTHFWGNHLHFGNRYSWGITAVRICAAEHAPPSASQPHHGA